MMSSYVSRQVSVSCSYGQQYAAQPVKIKNSQTDWWKAEDWTIDAVRQQIGDHSVFRSIRACKEGQKDRQSKRCHRVKEKDPEMLGKTWAAMTEVDLKKEKISNYNDLFDKQVCATYIFVCELCSSQRVGQRPGGALFESCHCMIGVMQRSIGVSCSSFST